jgi:divalent metal cation (Fe/Co/Zn/Cd) transporter
VVIGVSPGAAVGQGHATADAVEAAVGSALPNADVVVHVEPLEEAAVRERAHAAALAVPRVREVHNVSVLSVGGGTEVSLHLKLPGNLSLEEAHAIAEEVERAIVAAAPEISAVQTHLEPLMETGGAAEVKGDAAAVRAVVREVAGCEPHDLRFLDTAEGLVAYMTLRLEAGEALADAHARASEIEERIRLRLPEIADVVVHTEPE